MAKFHIELDTVECFESQFLSPEYAQYGLISSSGDTFEQLMENASVQVCDEDGDVRATLGVGDLKPGYVRMIEYDAAQKLEELQFMEDSYA